MPAFSDDPVHQQSAENQKHGASTHKRRRNEEIISASHLKPRCFRKRDVCRQKHKRKQCRDDDIDDLAGGFGQAFRRLRYQAFRESHGRLSQKRGKDTKTS